MKIDKIDLPNIPYSFNDYPEVTKSEVDKRFERLVEKMTENNLSHVVLYGDREHSANLSYFTGGYDSRFEESLLIIQKDKLPTLIVGNEGYDYSNVCLLDHNKILFQTFSLQGMIRDKKKYLRECFKKCGLNEKSRIGIIGLKYFEKGEVDNPDHTYDIPHYIVRELSVLTPLDAILNVNYLISHPLTGIRCTLTHHDVARFEYMNNYLSNQMKEIILNLEVGMSESEAISVFDFKGIPFVVHPVVNFGKERVLLGLASPSFTQTLKKGDPISIGLGIQGASIARTGFAGESENDFIGEKKNTVNEFYFPYFKALKNWYEYLDIGVNSRDVFDSVMKIIGHKRFGVNLNPGHQIHLEEWINSPFRADQNYKLRSGMAFQCDIIAFPGEPYIGVHVEDTLVLADVELRTNIENTYPNVFERIKIRQNMMKEILGIDIHDSVLPLSNIQSVLHPFLLNPEYAVIAR